jgi:SWI/SNF-related matrix-associated actin-dependent regulator 1 of chromatin subfamily A
MRLIKRGTAAKPIYVAVDVQQTDADRLQAFSFIHDRVTGFWYTTLIEHARHLEAHADDTLKAELSATPDPAVDPVPMPVAVEPVAAPPAAVVARPVDPNAMRLVRNVENGATVYVMHLPKRDREIAKAAGFRWDPERTRWWTDREDRAKLLAAYADADLRRQLEAVQDRPPMEVFVENGVYFARTADYDVGSRARDAGMTWNRERRLWYTTNLSRIAPFREYATPEIQQVIDAHLKVARETLEESRSVEADIELPMPEGYNLFPFQKAGIAFASKRKSVLIGDEMGLGKTLQGIGTLLVTDTFPAVVVCPASVKLNWGREIDRWSMGGRRVHVISGRPRPDQTLPEADVYVVNYDIVGQWGDQLLARNPKGMILDEIHYCRNEKTQRSKATLALLNHAERKIGLSGTPVVNRVKELWPVLSTLFPETFDKRWEFINRYVYGGKLDELQVKLRSAGMIRRLKVDVMSELPPKMRSVIELPINGEEIADIVEQEKALWDQQEGQIARLQARVRIAEAGDDKDTYNAALKALRKGYTVAFNEMSKIRKRVALAKIPYVIEHVREALETGEKIILFGHHHEVIDAIVDAFPDITVKVDGRDSDVARQRAVDRFQNDPDIRLFVGGLRSASEGITLTASSHVIFAECDWTPGKMAQAEDRAHRIGQLSSVTIQMLMFEGSLDARMAEILVQKQEIIDASLDDDVEDEDGLLVALTGAEEMTLPDPVALMRARVAAAEAGTEDRAARQARIDERRAAREARQGGNPRQNAEERAEERARRRGDRIDHEVAAITPDQIAVIHQATQYLSDLDTDRASELNGVGYNKSDSYLGHELASLPELTARQAVLARTMLIRYRRQLGDHILINMGVALRGADAAPNGPFP